MILAVPGPQNSLHVHGSATVHVRQVNLRVELANGSLLGVVVTASDREEVQAVLEASVGRADNRSVPRGEVLVVGVVKAVGDAGVAQAVLTLLQFLEKLKGSWLCTRGTQQFLVNALGLADRRCDPCQTQHILARQTPTPSQPVCSFVSFPTIQQTSRLGYDWTWESQGRERVRSGGSGRWLGGHAAFYLQHMVFFSFYY